MVQSVLALPEHLDVFERGIAAKLDFSFSGPQGARLARMVGAGQITVGAIHTYLELFGRYFVDLTPRVSLVAAQAANPLTDPKSTPLNSSHLSISYAAFCVNGKKSSQHRPTPSRSDKRPSS